MRDSLTKNLHILITTAKSVRQRGCHKMHILFSAIFNSYYFFVQKWWQNQFSLLHSCSCAPSAKNGDRRVLLALIKPHTL